MLFPRTLYTLKPQQAVLCNSLVWNTKLFNLLTSIPRQDKTSIFAEIIDGSKKSSSLHSLQWFNLSSEQQELTHQALAYVQVSLQATQQMWTAYQASLPHPTNQATTSGSTTTANAGNSVHTTATANLAAQETSTPTLAATTTAGTAKATQEVKEFTRTIIDNQELDDIYDPNLALLHHSDYKQRHSYEIPLDHPSYRELTAQGETVDPTTPNTDFTVSNFDLEFFSAEFENDFTTHTAEQESTYLFDTELLTKLARQANLLADDAEPTATFSKLGFTSLGDNPTVAQILRNSEVRELVDGLSQDLYAACSKLIGSENFHWLLPQEGNHEWGDRTPSAWYLWVVNWMLLTNTKVEQLRHEKLLNIGAKFHLEMLPWQRQVAQTSFQALADWDEEQTSLIASSKYLPQSITPREAEKVFFPTLQELTTLQHKLPSYVELRDNFRVQQLEARRNLYSSIYTKLAVAHNNPKILAALAASQTQVTPVSNEQSFAQWLPAQLESIRYIESNYLQANYTLNYLNANNIVVVPSTGTGATAKVKAKTSAELATEQETDTLQEQNNSSALAQENLEIVATIRAATTATTATSEANEEANEEVNNTTSECDDALLKFTMLDLETPTSSNPWYNLGIYAGLPGVPNRINCFDVSHLNGEFTKASCVVRDQQGIVPNEYRHYNITGITPGDDMAAMAQATFKRLDGIVDLSEVPDILLIDGKTSQCKAVNLVYVQYQPLINQKVIYWNLITSGQHLLQFTARKQNRLFGNQESNQLGLLAVERFYQLRTKAHLELQALELTPLCWDTGLRLATAVQQLQITNNRLTNALAMLLAFANMHEERWAQSTFGTMENLAALKSIPNTQNIPWRRLNWLTQQPLETTFEQLFAEVHLVEYYARNFHPCAIVGVYKQFNRKTHAELFLNGRTNTNITIPPYSSEQFILLDLRDRAHNYANTKRLTAQDKTMHNNQDILASIPGLGQVSLKKIYTHFKDTGGLLEWYQRDGSLRYLVNQVGLTNKVAQLLLEHLPKLFAA